MEERSLGHSLRSVWEMVDAIARAVNRGIPLLDIIGLWRRAGSLASGGELRRGG